MASLSFDGSWVDHVHEIQHLLSLGWQFVSSFRVGKVATAPINLYFVKQNILHREAHAQDESI